ncbi:competence protein ComK [Ureibacillus sp. FSL K6-8385]|uniref:Competence protein ComK n=1 Tax=Ureibacillus terrenus TaxID=118246 RepID=A0A540V3S7_9BACL|nr:competence protein ComK [Ureibacillus terrenus]MED3763084.1 competence protein ComK [Ureibacillus terrenus]TQE91402.1 hypothetical protein FKZ59_05340 [Ureibacillus terrenus]
MTTVKKVKSYYISPKTYTIEPIEYEGKTCSRVSEKSSVYIVEKKPYKIVDDTYRKLGSTYQAAIDFSKRFLGNRKKVPIVVPYQQLYSLIPVFSPHSLKNIWISQHAIHKIQQSKGKTIVILKNDDVIHLPIHYLSFMSQFGNATLLLNHAIEERAEIQRTLSFLDDLE